MGYRHDGDSDPRRYLRNASRRSKAVRDTGIFGSLRVDGAGISRWLAYIRKAGDSV